VFEPPAIRVLIYSALELAGRPASLRPYQDREPGSIPTMRRWGRGSRTSHWSPNDYDGSQADEVSI